MLTGIKKIQGMGVFGNFVPANDLPDFARFNIIYGENGSGKTTLSRLFGALESGEHAEHPDLEYTILTQSDQLTKGQKYARKVRVFNSDYVEANIGQFQGPLQHILIVGEENKALADEVKAEKSIRDERTQKIEAANKAADKLEAEKGRIFSSIAKTIGEATSGSTLRSYRKPDAESAFAKNRNPNVLDGKQLEMYRATVRQEQLDLVAAIALPTIDPDHTGALRAVTDVANEVSALVRSLLQRSAQSGALKRLTEQPLIAKWVEEGLELHLTHRSERCEFCDQTLPALRLDQLAEHFGAEDQRLKLEIEAAQRLVLSVIDALESLSVPPKSALYGELRGDFEVALSALESARNVLVEELKTAFATLHKKLMQRASSYSSPVSIDTKPVMTAVETISDLIDRHNAKTAGFDQAKAQARGALEEHYLSTIGQQVEKLETQISEQKELATKLTHGAADLQDTRSLKAIAESIESKQTQVSNAHVGGAELTSNLRKFLGRTDLTFESGDDGYHVQRRGKPAKRLSEGEKTAIAFLYFIVQLGDQDFDIREGIVVIDDPVSSLDSASIYQAFAFLKNAVKEAKQIFILTHNFDFLKLLLDWFKNGKKTTKSYYMIVCAESERSRDACIVPLDELLLKHPTEYHYLFKVLHAFKSDGTIRSSYHIPNIARKVLETFLEFYIPSNGNMYERLEATDFDPHKKTAIYKFANELSHRTGKGFDPALVAETQKNVTYLLEMIKSVAPLHYEGLERLSSTN